MHLIRLLSLALVLSFAAGPAAALTITVANVPLTEDFNTLATVTGSAMPIGWTFLETGSGANTTYGAGNGSSSTGNTYSFGATNDSDRALGALRTSSLGVVFGTVVINQTGAVITQLDLQYIGEQWRLGATGRVDRLDFAYSFDATSLATGTWIEFDGLDFVGPVTAGVTGALDGNLFENQLFLSQSITGLSFAPGASLWLRWSDFEATGSDDGLAIDNFSIAAKTAGIQSVPDHLPVGWAASALTGVLLLGTRFTRRTLV